MKKTVVSLVGATALAASVVALAGGPDAMPAPVHHGGFYAGADLGYANSPNSINSLEDTLGLTQAQKDGLKGVDTDKGGFAWGAHLGYAFNEYVALEAGYIRLPKLGFDQNNDFLGYDDNNVFYGAVKASYPVIKNFSVFVKAGYSIIDSSVDAENTQQGIAVTGVSETSYSPLVGGGFEYKVMPHLGVAAQYTALIQTGNGKKGNHFPTTHIGTLGLNYYF